MKDRRGATAIEYGLYAMGISLAVIPAVQLVGTNSKSTYQTIADNLKAPPPQTEFFGTNGDDLLIGNGTLGNTFHGLGGNDIMVGGSGVDTFNGGGGSDTASYRNSTGPIRVDLTNPASNTGDAAGDIYNGIQNAEGTSYDDQLVVGAGGHAMGGAGNDDLTIGVGGFATGGTGNDVIHATSWGTSTIYLDNGDGDDIVHGYASTLALVFGDDVPQNSLNFNVSGTTLTIDYGTAGSSLTLPSQAVWPYQNYIGSIGWEDGTQLPMTGSAIQVYIDDSGGTVNLNGATINGGNGNDTITVGEQGVALGGGGNDDLTIGVGGYATGGTGDDVFHTTAWGSSNGVGTAQLSFYAGDGHDTIQGYYSYNSLYFGPGITLGSLTFNVSGTTMTMGYGSNGDTITMPNQAAMSLINSITLYGTRTQRVFVPMTGSDLQVYIDNSGGTVNMSGATVHGGTGNDTITVGQGGTALGGAGNDTINIGVGGFATGGTGDDVFHTTTWGTTTITFNSGDGSDTIYGYGGGAHVYKFGPGIASGDVQFRRDGDFMVVDYPGGSVRLDTWAPSAQGAYISSVILDDGTVLTVPSL